LEPLNGAGNRVKRVLAPMKESRPVRVREEVADEARVEAPCGGIHDTEGTAGEGDVEDHWVRVVGEDRDGIDRDGSEAPVLERSGIGDLDVGEVERQVPDGRGLRG